MCNLFNSASHHRERPDTIVSCMNIKHASVSYNAINKNRLNKNDENQRNWKPMWGIQRDKRCLACSFMPDRETGACWELMNHISRIQKKYWKRKSDIRKHWNLRLRVICLGSDAAFCHYGWCLLVNSVPSCTLTALWHPLWHQDKGAAFNTAPSFPSVQSSLG